MGVAELKVLGLLVPLAHNRHYSDEGFVKNIFEHAKKLYAKHGFPNLSFPERYTVGEHFKIGDGRHIYHYILYLKAGSAARMLRVRAHEETHALDQMGRMDILADALRKEQGVDINFKEIKDEEVRAELGVIYALKKHGIGTWHFWFPIDKDYIRAKIIYKRNKIK